MTLPVNAELEAPPIAAARPRIFVGLDAQVSRLRISQILRAAGYDVVLKEADVSLSDSVRDAADAALLLLPFDEDPSTIETIRRIQADGLHHGAPILGVTGLEYGRVDFESLRSAGVCGVLDKASGAKDVIFRVNQLVRRVGDRRRHMRAPTRLPVELTADEKTTPEVATSLSSGGLRVHSSRHVEPNTDVRVAFELPGSAGEWIEATGRAIYGRKDEASGSWDFGLFFYPLGEREANLIHLEVERLLSLQ